MRRYVLTLSVLLLFIMPNLLISLFGRFIDSSPAQNNPTTPSVDDPHVIHVLHNDDILQMELDEYVVCVLLGEMPANFHTEALKAQAIATRTYTLRNLLNCGKHENAFVCTEASCCQAYVPISEYINRGMAEDDVNRIKSAVSDTTGQVLQYAGKLIDATYFSCSGGRTEDASAVWGNSVPYLLSVDSPGEENARNYLTTISITRESFLRKLGLPENTEFDERDISIIYTNGKGIAEMRIVQYTFSGTDLRKRLELPSTMIHFKFTDRSVEITTKGNGHRVGMSQYGANAMAEAGKDYKEILSHYYTGTELRKLTEAEWNTIFDKADNL